jgi:rRNA processing protein Gar1
VSGAGLRRIGQVLHLSKSGNLILQLEQSPVPIIGSRVCDYKLRNIGVVNNILGPVGHAYVSVKPTTNLNDDLGRKILYLVEKE